MSSNAVSYGSRLRTIASWVRVLAFGAVAHRESYSIDSGEVPTEEWTVRSSKFAVTTGKGYINTLASSARPCGWWDVLVMSITEDGDASIEEFFLTIVCTCKGDHKPIRHD